MASSSAFSYRSGSSSNPYSFRTSSTGGGGGFLSGVGSFIGHLGTDIKDAAFGIPMGLVNLAKHPIGSVEAMAKSTWHDWSPLFHGDFSKEWTQFMAHPLAPILDLGMVAGAVGAPFTAGASLDVTAEADLARAGIAVGDIGKMGDAISQSARIVKVPAEAKFLPGVQTNKLFLVRYHAPLEGDMAVPAYVKQLSNNPLIQARQVALAKLGGQLSDGIASWTGRTTIRPGLVPSKAEASFERELSRRQVAFQANKELVTPPATAALADARKALEGNGVDTSQLSDYEVASHAQISQMIQAGQWLHAAPTEQWAGLLQWMHGQLLKHPMYVAKDYAEAKTLMKQGFVGVNKAFPGIVAGKSFEDILGAASGVGRKGFLTRVEERMAKTPEGGYMLVPHHAAFNWMREGQNSASFLKSLWKNPARLWKMTQVGWSPKTVVNTSVGNSFMLLMGQPRAFLYLVDGIRAAKGAERAGAMLRETGHFEPGILAEHFSDVIHSSNAASKAGVSPVSDLGTVQSKAGRILKTGFYGGVHRVEQGLKRGSIIASLHASSEVKDLMGKGMGFEDAAQRALQNNSALRDQVARTALLHIGNYEMFSKGEQKLKNVVPFYSWDRHIVAHTVDMLATKPLRAGALAAVGNQGSAATDQYLPGVPVYMRTNLPLAALGIASTKTLDTIGLNPYSSIADLAGAGIGLTLGSSAGPNFAPSEDTAGQLSPLITGLIQGVTGHSILTDKALPSYGGPISTAAVNVFNNLPQVRIARLAAFGAPQGSTPPLYADTFQRLLSKYVGVPVQQPNLARAQATEAKIEKKKKSSVYSFR